MDSINEMDNLTNANGDKTSLEIIKQQFNELTGLNASNECIIKMLKDNPTMMRDPIDYASAKSIFLKAYDEFEMSNKTESKLEHQRYMEEMTRKEKWEDTYNYYYVYKNVYFEWNKLHMMEHPERHNSIGNVAIDVVDNVKEIFVDTRKNYGEVRYILKCENSEHKRIVVTCYRYDKTHIRIVTAWEEQL